MDTTAPVAELALRLHRTERPDLRIDLPPGYEVALPAAESGYSLTGTALEFDSLQKRNEYVAAAAFEEVCPAGVIDAARLFESALELWGNEIGHSDQASGRLLGLAAAREDVLAAGASEIQAGRNVFDVLHVLEAALPYIDKIDHASLRALCEVKFGPTKNDFAGGGIHNALETWLAERPAEARLLHDVVAANPTEATTSLLGNAAVGLARTHFSEAAALASADANSPIALRAAAGAWTLGRLLHEASASSEQLAAVSETLIQLIQGTHDDRRSQAVRAATNSMHLTRSFDVLLKRLAADGDQIALAGIATTFFLKSSEVADRDDLDEWLDLLSAISPEYGRSVDNLDHALSRWVGQGTHIPAIVDLLSKWVARFGKPVSIDATASESFSGTFAKLEARADVWSAVVTNWLLSDDKRHPAALAAILSAARPAQPQTLCLDKQQTDALDSSDLLFLGRRLLGYVHDKGQLTSLAMSFLDSNEAKERTHPMLRALLLDEIGYDYPTSTIEACRLGAKVRTGTDAETFLNEIADTLERSVTTIRELPRINELRPPMRLRRQFALARAKQMHEAMEEAKKKSVLRSLATEIPIKAGSGTFSYFREAYGSSMQMSSISHSIELPHREIFDPIGNSIRHLGFRLAMRGES